MSKSMPDCMCSHAATVHPKFGAAHPCSVGGCPCDDYLGLVASVNLRTGDVENITSEMRAAMFEARAVPAGTLVRVEVSPGEIVDLNGVPVVVDDDETPLCVNSFVGAIPMPMDDGDTTPTVPHPIGEKMADIISKGGK